MHVILDSCILHNYKNSYLGLTITSPFSLWPEFLFSKIPALTHLRFGLMINSKGVIFP